LKSTFDRLYFFKSSSTTMEEAMTQQPRALTAQLSPHEESTLKRIGHGTLPIQDNLRVQDVMRLKQFGFVEAENGEARLTPLGAERTALIDE
jgi:hypothetical protein